MSTLKKNIKSLKGKCRVTGTLHCEGTVVYFLSWGGVSDCSADGGVWESCLSNVPRIWSVCSAKQKSTRLSLNVFSLLCTAGCLLPGHN